ncbi:hypothetical protein BOTBODRAFT_58670 [Botryobasidium botryosum FD-172 SS1]|uniref:Uncharacterized protein n=1 Tax=Botryobasidium botryosum (strain FD-172 SS1) TaxID=930990 RepID=A0A067M435_BOTB1|nr:hypothetical protein BOTBODRAFT_58670 [Botryobasidium botryosum FD-172 SS1]
MDVDSKLEDTRVPKLEPTQAVERETEKSEVDVTKVKEGGGANGMSGVVKSEDAKDKDTAQAEEKKERKDVVMHPPTAPRRQPPTQPRGHGLNQSPSSSSLPRGPLHGLSHAPTSRASQSPLRQATSASANASTSANPPLASASASPAVAPPSSLPIPLGPRSDRGLPSGPRADRLKGKDNHEKDKDKEKDKERVKEEVKEKENTPAPATPISVPSVLVIPLVKKASLTPELDAELARLQAHRHNLQREHALKLFPAVQVASQELALAKIDLKVAETKRKNAEDQLPSASGLSSSGLFSSGDASTRGGASSTVY